MLVTKFRQFYITGARIVCLKCLWLKFGLILSHTQTAKQCSAEVRGVVGSGLVARCSRGYSVCWYKRPQSNHTFAKFLGPQASVTHHSIRPLAMCFSVYRHEQPANLTSIPLNVSVNVPRVWDGRYATFAASAPSCAVWTTIHHTWRRQLLTMTTEIKKVDPRKLIKWKRWNSCL